MTKKAPSSPEVSRPIITYVLDTNVLLDDPAALFRFREHNVYLPETVRRELDRFKKGQSQIAANARQVFRYLEALTNHASLPLKEVPLAGFPDFSATGKLLFQTEPVPEELLRSFSKRTGDDAILAAILSLKGRYPDQLIKLVSKDRNFRISAQIRGIESEDYYHDSRARDIDPFYTGIQELPDDFLKSHTLEPSERPSENGTRFYRFTGPIASTLLVNQFVYCKGDAPFYTRVLSVSETSAELTSITDYTKRKNAVFGITAKNREQNFALNLLMDPEIETVFLLGSAGTGKTILTLASAFSQIMMQKIYEGVVMTRALIPSGEDIGFVPGGEKEKVGTWMGALMDAIDVLSRVNADSSWNRGGTNKNTLLERVDVRASMFMRGRSLQDTFFFIDEAQNNPPIQMKTLFTRAGHGTKIACAGNPVQIDTPYLTPEGCGIIYAANRLKGHRNVGVITLRDIERSRVAKLSEERL